MRQRSRAREVALQLLFQHDINPKVARSAITQFVMERLSNATLESFCLKLYDGVVAQQKAIDTQLSKAAENWRLSRMTIVDRNVMRMGVFEMVHAEEKTPVAVALNEAVELSRRYGSKDSSAFVNGVLDRIARDVGVVSPT